MKQAAFLISIPHAGELIPDETPWLKNLDEVTLMFDVDRFVDLLYKSAVETHRIPHVVAKWHRYVVDLNRLPEDVDVDSVVGAKEASGKHTTGFHWVKTTEGHPLIKSPISMELHKKLVEKYFNPFHEQVLGLYKQFRESGAKKIYHLDAHSMPSVGNSSHRDPGERRADIVVSDFHGKSCEAAFKDLVIEAYSGVGFKVAYNWPYFGGRVTQTYGKPELGQHAIQVEMNRDLYMNEETKQLRKDVAADVQQRLVKAVGKIASGLSTMV